MYEAGTSLNYDLYRIGSSNSYKYVYGSIVAVNQYKQDNPGQTADPTTYEVGESAGNVWDCLDNPRAV
jgi:hypothetical protein